MGVNIYKKRRSEESVRTYTHGIIGYLIYLKGTKQQQLLAVIGAMVPDLFLAIGFIFHIIDGGFFDILHDLFHHSFLQTITELMHSFVLVVPLLIIAFFFYKVAVPFLVGMLSHIIIDLLTHQKWAYNHLFPIPIEPFVSPIAYTNLWFTILEHLFVIGFAIWFWKHYSQKKRKK